MWLNLALAALLIMEHMQKPRPGEIPPHLHLAPLTHSAHLVWGCILLSGHQVKPGLSLVDDNWDDDLHLTPLLALPQDLPLGPTSQGTAR